MIAKVVMILLYLVGSLVVCFGFFLVWRFRLRGLVFNIIITTIGLMVFLNVPDFGENTVFERVFFKLGVSLMSSTVICVLIFSPVLVLGRSRHNRAELHGSGRRTKREMR